MFGGSGLEGVLSSANFHFFLLPLFVGRPWDKFGATRGLRQGDPLSPFFFTLVVDEVNFLKWLVVGREEVEITHLQFADDIIFFLFGEIRNLRNLLLIFRGIQYYVRF